eukprot:scaffold1504_cov417-Prasinococcus_capsulatus_cf.AAC.11
MDDESRGLVWHRKPCPGCCFTASNSLLGQNEHETFCSRQWLGRLSTCLVNMHQEALMLCVAGHSRCCPRVLAILRGRGHRTTMVPGP